MSKPTKKKVSKKPVAKKRAYRVVMPGRKKSNSTGLLLAMWVVMAVAQFMVLMAAFPDHFKEVADMVMAYAA